MGATKRRAGRPIKLDQRITEDRTVADMIVMALRNGSPIRPAAAAAGVSPTTLQRYLREGARAQARITAAEGAGLDPPDLTDDERLMADFSTRAAQAQAQWEVEAASTIERVGRGGIPLREVRTRQERRNVGTDDNPKWEMVVVEQTVVESESLPDARVMLQRLAQRFPDRYSPTRGQHLTVHHTADPLDEPLVDEVDAAMVANEALDRWVQEAIETNATEVDDADAGDAPQA